MPKNALFRQDHRYYVYVSVNNRAALREVETGIENQKQVEIISGLKEGERLILSPDKKIKDLFHSPYSGRCKAVYIYIRGVLFMEFYVKKIKYFLYF